MKKSRFIPAFLLSAALLSGLAGCKKETEYYNPNAQTSSVTETQTELQTEPSTQASTEESTEAVSYTHLDVYKRQYLQSSGQRPLLPLMIEQRSTLSPTKCSRILSAPLHRSSKSQSRKKDRSSFLVSLFPSIISSASFCISMFFPPPGKFELIVLFFVLIVNLFYFLVNILQIKLLFTRHVTKALR